MQNWKVILHTKKARKVYERAKGKDKTLLDRALDSLERNPFGGDLRHVKGHNNEIGRRVGDWRIIYSLNKRAGEIFVWQIGRKGDATYK